MPNTLIVPGLNGSGEGHWQSWWLQDDRSAIAVQQADWSNPSPEAWLAALEAAVIKHPHSIIVAHSLGSVLTARLASSPVAHLVAGALLVAPADIVRTSTLHRRTYEFGSLPQRRLPFPSLVVASRDDPYMAFSKAGMLARTWGSRFIDLGFAGHINIASGFGRWTTGYALARPLQLSEPVVTPAHRPPLVQPSL